MAKLQDAPVGNKIIEIPIDGKNTVIRRIVPSDTHEDDTPMGSRLLDERETDGILSRSSKAENIQVGDSVRLRPPDNTPGFDNTEVGTVEGKTRSGKYTVRWANGNSQRHETKELMKVW